ncbi:MAG: hypothetical protein INH41_11915 [Myxococcaceae bacterium]|jgi:hypothetical protein|nr:hypothetical protein [Myxococcaceae bacterium]
MMAALALGLLLSQTADGGVALPGPRPPLEVAAGLEVEGGVLSSGVDATGQVGAAGGLDVLAGLRPMLRLSTGDDFTLQLGPLVRLRLVDAPPLQRDGDVGRVIRREDWDRLGDVGELLQALRLGAPQAPLQLRAGPVQQKTLGLGHLVFRYSNRTNADARPAAATATLALGPVRAELFAADVLAGRLFAADVTWDVGRTFSAEAWWRDRATLALSFAHDFAFGTPARPPGPCATEGACVEAPALAAVTLAHLDGAVVVVRERTLTLMALGGVGARAVGSGDVGFLLGVAADLRWRGVELSARAEGRKQVGGFRHGYFGAQYELARFSGVGLGLTPQADERLPDAVSGFAEVRLRLARTLALDGAVEHFSFGRTDFDATMRLTAQAERLWAEVRVGAVGLGAAPRWLVMAGLRWRLADALYALGAAGTAVFPQADGTLARGVTASLGVGFDLER